MGDEMLTEKQAGPGGKSRPHQAHLVAAVPQAAARVAAVDLQDLVGAVPAHRPAAAVETSQNAQCVLHWRASVGVEGHDGSL